MSWTLTAWAQTRQGLAGIPWRDLTDDEYAAALRLYPELGDRGYFEPAGEAEADTTEDDEAPEVPGCTCRWKHDPFKAPEQHANYCAVSTAAEEGD